MMAVDALSTIARGKRLEGAILPPCRLEGLGSAAYGEEAIINLFRRRPLDGLDATDIVASPGHVALFAGDDALVADIHDEKILRIWRLGPGAPVPAEPAIGVPFDTDLHQARRSVALRPEDHPELDPVALETVRAVGYELAHGRDAEEGPAPWRTRLFVLRAFSSGHTAAALFAVHRLGSERTRTAGFSFLAARISFGPEKHTAPHVVRDRAGEQAIERATWRTGFA